MASNRMIFCSFPDDVQAEAVQRKLCSAGFSEARVSLLFPEHGKVKKYVLERHSKAPEGAATGGGAGGLMGGVLGWLVGSGALAIQGLDAFLAAGPVLAALSGAAVGAALGGLLGGLVGMGISEIEARAYQKKLKVGQVLVAAQARGEAELRRARRIFAESGGKDITETNELAA